MKNEEKLENSVTVNFLLFCHNSHRCTFVSSTRLEIEDCQKCRNYVQNDVGLRI